MIRQGPAKNKVLEDFEGVVKVANRGSGTHLALPSTLALPFHTRKIEKPLTGLGRSSLCCPNSYRLAEWVTIC
jgi:hypothetical protein